MTYRHHLSICEASLPADAFEGICAIAPEGRTPHGFRLQLDSDSADGGEVVRGITAICAAHGLKRQRTNDKTSYGHHVDRGYGHDLNQFELLILTRQVITQTGVSAGRAVLAADPAYKLTSVLRFAEPFVVSDAVRERLERGRLAGLRFGGSALKPDPESNYAKVSEKFWELQSSNVLPKMANSHQFVHPGPGQAEPFRGDYSRYVTIEDPPFSRGEVHYRAEDIKLVGTSDIARTFENYMEPHPALVISRRFYHYCLVNSIGLAADPVRLAGVMAGVSSPRRRADALAPLRWGCFGRNHI